MVSSPVIHPSPAGGVSVGDWLNDASTDVMNFLNEATYRFPDAISFAAGRPPDAFASARRASEWIERFVAARGGAAGDPWIALGQYGETNGMIRDLVARHLEIDEEIRVPPEAVMVTNGMQEAVLVMLAGLVDRAHDVLLAEDPCYVGFTGAAATLGLPVEPVARDAGLVDHVRQAIARVRAGGRRPRALYLVPDFSNPSGETLSLAERRELLAVADDANLLILEDAAYRGFAYDGDMLPSLKQLDRTGRVIYIGSFAKVLMPGVRIGFAVADAPAVLGGRAVGATVAQELSKVKSYTSVLTSPLA